MKSFPMAPRFGATLALLLLAGLAATAKAATAVSRSRSPQRTNKVMDPGFANAGQTAGLEIWRVEDFKPVPYPANQFGKFFTGDSYVILSTKVNKAGDKSWDIHFWLGSETSQDEAGAAAIFAVQLDEQLGGEPVQHREKQEHESQLFLSYFKSGVRYQPGGIVSGFHHVDPDQFETKLFQVKGSRNIRVKEVDPNFSSLNKGDCFILDVGKNIYVFVGSKSRRMERLKATAAANQIRDQDHAGKAKVTIVDEFSPESEFEEFFKALGGGSRDDVPSETTGGDDAQFEIEEERAATLYRISDASGTLRVETVGRRPLEANLLDEGDVFILDTGDADVFVWIGRSASPGERRESMTKADAYLSEHKRPAWTHVERISQGAEPAAFTQYFRTWQAVGEKHRRLVRSAHEIRLVHAALRPGTTKFKLEHIHDYRQDDLDTDDIMLLDVPEINTLYLWIGNGADAEEKERSGELAQQFIKSHGREDVTITTIHQGEELEDFKLYFPSWDPELWDNQVDARQLAKNYED